MTGSGSANASEPASLPFQFEAGVLTLRLHVQPGARRSAWAGRHGAGLKLRLAAPALDGRANRALVAYLAGAAGVPQAAVEIVRGEHARDKLVRIAPLSAAQFRELQRLWDFPE